MTINKKRKKIIFFSALICVFCENKKIFSAKTLFISFLCGKIIASVKDAKSTADAVCDACEAKSGNKCSDNKNICWKAKPFHPNQFSETLTSANKKMDSFRNPFCCLGR